MIHQGPGQDAIEEARKEGDADKTSRLERFDRAILTPMLKPVQDEGAPLEQRPYVAGGLCCMA